MLHPADGIKKHASEAADDSMAGRIMRKDGIQAEKGAARVQRVV